jgi:coniferyl-aldehyde dehydrogenase
MAGLCKYVRLMRCFVKREMSGMNSEIPIDISLHKVSSKLMDCFQLQRSSFLNSDIETYAERKTHLKNLKRMLVENREDLFEALCKDYGNRSYHESLFAEFVAVADDIDSTSKSLKKWMKVQRRGVDITMYFGAKNQVIPQPLGVVGAIIPWNFPINLTFTQLSAIFSAGNRAMVKMSENSLNLSKLLIELSVKYFPKEKLQFFDETGSVGPEFSKLPFDHLIFTGSGATGRKVMAAAAKNLTPVTLELGGKAPAIIDPNYPIETAVERIMFVKQFNAGQICTNVDYVFVHGSKLQEFVETVQSWVTKHVPDIYSVDYTSIIDECSFERLNQTIEEARSSGATVVKLNNQEADAELRKFPLHLVIDPPASTAIACRETFGPILMVKQYDNHHDVIASVNAQDRPLALYPFTNDKKLASLYIGRIMSGGVTVNDALFHVGQHDLPFGGVGGSGMGHYHGREGFETFSKLRPIMYQARFTALKFLAPPYEGFADRVFRFLAKIKSSC